MHHNERRHGHRDHRPQHAEDHQERRRIHREAVRQGGHHGARDEEDKASDSRVDPHGLARARPRARASADTRGGASSRSTGRSRAARRRSPSTPCARRSATAGVAAFIDAEHAFDVTYARGHRRRHTSGSSSRSPTTASRRSRSSRCSTRSGAVDLVVDRLGRRPHAQGRDRGRDGRRAHGAPGAADEPGAPQAHGRRPQDGDDARSSSTSCGRRSASIFGNPETTTGGNALKFYASVRLDVRRIGPVKIGDESVGGAHAGQGREEQVRGPVHARPSSTSAGGRASTRSEICSTSAWPSASIEKSGAHFSFAGTPSDRGGSGRARRSCRVRWGPSSAPRLRRPTRARRRRARRSRS